MSAPQCTICFHSIKKNQSKRLSCRCKSQFHMWCIWKWILTNPVCPICKDKIHKYPTQHCPENEYKYYVDALISKLKILNKTI